MSTIAHANDVKQVPLHFRSFIQTEDGTCIIVDGNVSATGRTREEAELEIARRKAADGPPMEKPLW